MMHIKHFAAARHSGLAFSLLLAIGGCVGGSTGDAPCTDCGPSVAPPTPAGLGLTDSPTLGVRLSDEPDPTLSAALSSAVVRVRRGANATLEVRVDRGAFEGEVAIWAEGLPTGTVAEPAVMRGSAPTGRLVIAASTTAALGGPHAFTVVVSATGVEPVAVPAWVVIAGAPGSLDQSFGEGGVAAFELEGIGVNAVGVDTRGRVVVAGRNFGAGGPFIERLTADGVLDPAYGEAALDVAPDHLRSSFGSDLVMVRDEVRLVMRAWRAGGAEQQLGLVALGESGQANVAVGRAGVVPLGWFEEDSAVPVALTAGAGSTFVRVGEELLVVRPTQTIRLALPTGAYPAWAMAQHDDTLTFGLWDTEGTGRRLERVQIAGGFDQTFGEEGLLQVQEEQAFDETVTHDVRLLSDGSGYAATQQWLDGSASGEVVRFTGGGELEPSFGDGGRVRLPEGERVQALLTDAGERAVVFTEHRPSFDRALRRYGADGRVDRTFGHGGEVALGALDLRGIRRVAHDATADRVVACGHMDGDSGWYCARFWL